jgi:transporter family-2 protein
MKYAVYAAWSVAAGALIPLMAILNARLARTLGEPGHAVAVLFTVALALGLLASVLSTGRLPSPAVLAAGRPIDLAGGAIVAFYVISVTLLAPRFGIGNVILFAMVAQIVTSAAIDHFGILGAAVRPLSVTRAIGITVLLAGLVIAQLPDKSP